MTRPERAARAALVPAIAVLLAGCGVLGGAPSGDRASLGDSLSDPVELAERAASDSTEAYWPFRLAEVHAHAGRPEDAERALGESLRRDPSYAPSLALLSKLHYESGRHDEAIAMLEAARAHGPFPQELLVALALHYDAVDRIEESAAIVASLEDTLRDWSTAGSALTYLRLRGEDFVHAQEVARRALDADPSAVNHNNYGIALLYAGKPREARRHFEQAVEKDAALPGPLYNLAIVDHFYLFDTAEARRWFDRYRELASDDPDRLGEVLPNELAGNVGPSSEVTP